MDPYLFDSPRIAFRQFTVNDAEWIFELNSDPEVMRFVHEEPFTDVGEARDFLEKYSYSVDGLGRWAMIEKISGDPLGWCGLKEHPNGDVDLGFRLFRTHWGRGFATEAAKKCIDIGFHEKGLHRIIGRVLEPNKASQRVLEKCGLTLVGPADFEDLPEALLYEIVNPPQGEKK